MCVYIPCRLRGAGRLRNGSVYDTPVSVSVSALCPVPCVRVPAGQASNCIHGMKLGRLQCCCS